MEQSPITKNNPYLLLLIFAHTGQLRVSSARNATKATIIKSIEEGWCHQIHRQGNLCFAIKENSFINSRPIV